jgi:hypothetical protein
MEAVVTELHQCLVEALRQRGPGAEDRPVTVAEIYQDLVPYRNVRSRLGVEMNADYEHALIRLLAGEHNLLRLEPVNAREDLRAELSSPNPNLGLYRKYAACDVWVDLTAATVLGSEENGAAPSSPQADASSGEYRAEPARVSNPASSASPTSAARGTMVASSDAAPPDTLARAATIASHPAQRTADSSMATTGAGGTRPPRGAAAAATVAASSEASARGAGPTGRSCAFCDEELPAGRQVRFCPHCGEDQQRRPCTACGEVLELGWRFCIACGTEMRAV